MSNLTCCYVLEVNIEEIAMANSLVKGYEKQLKFQNTAIVTFFQTRS